MKSLSSRAFGPRKLMKVAQSVFPIGCAGAENRLSTLLTTAIMGPCHSIALVLECVIGPVGTQPVPNVVHRADPPAKDRMLQVRDGQRAEPFLQPK